MLGKVESHPFGFALLNLFKITMSQTYLNFSYKKDKTASQVEKQCKLKRKKNMIAVFD